MGSKGVLREGIVYLNLSRNDKQLSFPRRDNFFSFSWQEYDSIHPNEKKLFKRSSKKSILSKDKH